MDNQADVAKLIHRRNKSQSIIEPSNKEAETIKNNESKSTANESKKMKKTNCFNNFSLNIIFFVVFFLFVFNCFYLYKAKILIRYFI